MATDHSIDPPPVDVGAGGLRLGWLYAILAVLVISLGAFVGSALYYALFNDHIESNYSCLSGATAEAESTMIADPTMPINEALEPYYTCLARQRGEEAAAIAVGVTVTVVALVVVTVARSRRDRRRLVRTALRGSGRSGVEAGWVKDASQRFELWRSRFGLNSTRAELVVAGPAVREAFTGAGPGLRPWVIVPAALTRPDQTAAFDAIVCHELAHVARRDTTWVGLVQALRWLVVPATLATYLPELVRGEPPSAVEITVALGRAGVMAGLLLLLTGVLLRVRELDADSVAVSAGAGPDLRRLLRSTDGHRPRGSGRPQFGRRVRALFATHPSADQRIAALATRARTPQKLLLFVRAAAVAGAIAPLSWAVRAVTYSLTIGTPSQAAVTLGVAVVGLVLPFGVPLPRRGEAGLGVVDSIGWATSRRLLAAGALVGFIAGSIAMPALNTLSIAPTGPTVVNGSGPEAVALMVLAVVCAGSVCVAADLMAWYAELGVPRILARVGQVTFVTSTVMTSVWATTMFDGDLLVEKASLVYHGLHPWALVSLLVLLSLWVLPVVGWARNAHRGGLAKVGRQVARGLWLPAASALGTGVVVLVWHLTAPPLAELASERDGIAYGVLMDRVFRGFVACFLAGAMVFALSRPAGRSGTARASSRALTTALLAGAVSLAVHIALTQVSGSWFWVRVISTPLIFWTAWVLPFLAAIAVLAPRPRLWLRRGAALTPSHPP
ncbi:MAG: M48 family metalloprotease, partial [Nocardioides sp.]